MKDLAGKTAFITGAASGIGLGVATALAQRGVKVMMCDIERDALDRAAAGLKQTNADVDAVVADVSLKSELQAAAEATLARYGEVHILHNNAGVAGGGAYGAWTDAGWSWTIGVNLMAVVWGCEIFGPLIERHGQGGQIVNTASIAGLISGSGNAYNVTKYGVVALSEGLRVELAPRGIGVSVLCPGPVKTGILKSERNRPAELGASKLSREDIEAVMRSSDPANTTFIEPERAARAVLEAVRRNEPYVITHPGSKGLVEARFRALLDAYDRTRERNPDLP